MKEKVTIIIPSLNPDEKLMQVVGGLKDAGFSDILIVNDGSDSEHIKPFEEAGKLSCCTVLTHEVNKGKGRALKTAFAYVKENRKDSLGVVTVDGDNQHTVKDIEACANKMVELKEHVILGCRDFSGENVPTKSRLGNNITKNVFKYLCGLNISDTQTGLRAIPYDALDAMLEIKGERFEYETNMLLELKEYMIPYSEVKIETVYIEDNATSHFNPLVDSFKIYKVIFKFVLSSASSCIIDLAIFTLAFALLDKELGNVTASGVATVIARVISSIFNFTVNKKAVFKSKTSVGSALVRYYMLATVQLLVSMGALGGLTYLLKARGLVVTILKAVVDTILFCISFPIQRRWVFKK